ncbi:MAG: carboxymuconolactone decarboxylase family protein [Candidatus Latescibacteria bacterium]|nr:carboxymuconolactone decarboxylase family protein [Candidatus Latescibacterota bacterium]MBT4138145.1 carboxymuconolactone decarboxylase family protein [Candidatus Latescibacterota bacterium]
MSDRYEKGLNLMREMVGSDQADAICDKFKDLHPDFERFVMEFVMADLYARDGLDLKTRLLCTVSALTVLGRQDQLGVHIQRALGAGATQKELEEVILQMSAFGGFPATWDALNTAKPFFQSSQTE